MELFIWLQEPAERETEICSQFRFYACDVWKEDDDSLPELPPDDERLSRKGDDEEFGVEDEEDGRSEETDFTDWSSCVSESEQDDMEMEQMEENSDEDGPLICYESNQFFTYDNWKNECSTIMLRIPAGLSENEIWNLLEKAEEEINQPHSKRDEQRVFSFVAISDSAKGLFCIFGLGLGKNGIGKLWTIIFN